MDMKLAAVAAMAVLTLGAAPATKAPPPKGYLTDATAPNTYTILPAAPLPGSTRYEADRTTFLAMRALKDGPRWALAVNDVDQTTFLKDMSCAVGVELTPQNAPHLAAMLSRARPDIGRAVNVPKDIYKRQRPYLIDEGPICVEKSDSLAASPDYPSGHSTFSWTIGLILAELAPDRATPILVRARAYGESRLVCGVHNMSAVEAGRTNASILVAGLHGSEDFRKDLEAARKDVVAARKAGPAPDPTACAQEAALTAKSPY
jgi:acid phosphatase (class A)